MEKVFLGKIDNIVNNDDIIKFCSEKLSEYTEDKLFKYYLLQTEESGFKQYYIDDLEFSLLDLKFKSNYKYRTEEEFKEYLKYLELIIDFMKFNEIDHINLQY